MSEKTVPQLISELEQHAQWFASVQNRVDARDVWYCVPHGDSRGGQTELVDRETSTRAPSSDSTPDRETV